MWHPCAAPIHKQGPHQIPPRETLPAKSLQKSVAEVWRVTCGLDRVVLETRAVDRLS